MTSKQAYSEPADGVYAKASEWLVEIRAGDLDSDGEARFGAWLRRSPDHIRAYMELAALWSDIPRLAAGMEVDIDAIVAEARAHRNVARLAPSAPRAVSESRGVRQPARVAIFALAASAVIGGLALGLWYGTSRDIYDTAIGEDRLINLADGTEIELSARTRIRVHLTANERHVDLLRGQALFRVAKDPARPFVVASQKTRIRAVGTQFDVQQRPSGTTVTVMEGRVSISADSQGPAIAPVLLAAGEQVLVPSAARIDPRPRPIDPRTATTWREHVLNFQDTPLSDVVEEFNRYNKKQIILQGTALQTLRISGVFSATKPHPLLKFLSEEMQLEVTESEREIQVQPRAQNLTPKW